MTTSGAPDPARLALNGITTNNWSLREAAEGCARAGIPWMAPWRDKIAAAGGAEAAARILRDAGLRASSLCRGGFFPAATAAERQVRIEDNLRAIDDAVTIGAPVLVLVCGPAPDKDIAAARQMVADGLAGVLPYAAERGVKLGIEPLHPMFAADRSVINTLTQANDLVEQLGSAHLGVVVDVYHVWWDPRVHAEIARAAGYILAFHVSDWIVPMPDLLLGRGMMGDGVIELRKLRHAVESAGYNGPIEVEILNQAVWDTPGDQTLALMRERYRECV